jgi:hypothetical protein
MAHGLPNGMLGVYRGCFAKHIYQHGITPIHPGATKVTNYLVVAYRWGWLNNHQYIIYCGPDETKAIALADSETGDRGGKYGAAVYKFNDDGTDYEKIYYTSSSYGEEKPYHNYRIDMFESLGHCMHDYADGYVFLPDPDKKGFMKRVDKRPPTWIKELVEREEKHYQDRARILGGQSD